MNWRWNKYHSIWYASSQKLSPLWRSIKTSFIQFKDNIGYLVGKDFGFSLFFDPWCNSKSLVETFGDLCFSCIGLYVLSHLNALMTNNHWRFALNCPGRVCYKTIKRILILDDVDVIKWKEESSFTNKILKYKLFSSLPDYPLAKFIWFKGFSINYALYCWMVVLGKLKTSDYFAKLELGPNFKCCFCNNSLESHSHLFFGCSFSRNLFKELVPRGNFFLLEPTISEALLFASSFF